MLGYQCTNVNHNGLQVQGFCQNKFCKEPSRRICLQCINDHQKNDKHFNLSDIKNEKQIQQMINKFKEQNLDRMNIIALQCWIQQYILNIELIEYVKLWNYKYHKIHEILLQLEQFNNIQMKQISVLNYLDQDNNNISLVEYFQKYQQKLIEIDDLKDKYIIDIKKEQIYNEIDVKTEQNKLSINLEYSVNQFNSQLFLNIKQNNLHIKKDQKNEEFIFAICQLIFKQGCELRTNILYEKFKFLQDNLLDKSDEKYKSFNNQSNNITWRQQTDELEKTFFLPSINQPKQIQRKQVKQYNIKRKLIKDDDKFSESFKKFDHAIKNLLQYYQKQEQTTEINDQTFKIQTKNALAYQDEGLQLYYLQKYEQAIEMCDQAIQINPKFAQAYNNKGTSLFQLKKYKQAIEMYDQAIEIDPKYALAYNNKGSSLYHLQKYEQAIVMYDHAIDLDPKLIDASHKKGHSLYNLQKYEQAIEIYDQAIKIDPKFVDAYYSKAYTLYNLKQYSQSKDSLQKGLKLQPNNNEMKQLLEQCDQQLKQQIIKYYQ